MLAELGVKEGTREILLATHDRGSTWRSLPTHLPPTFQAGEPIPGFTLPIDFVDPEHGFVLGVIGHRYPLYGTSDGGRTLRLLESAQPLFSVSFVTPERGWANGGYPGGLFVTTDGGRIWRRLPLRVTR